MYNDLGVILKLNKNQNGEKMRVYNTQQRKSLIDFLSRNSDKAFTIEEIICSMGEGRLSQSTAYRLMTKLVEDGLVHRSVKGNSRNSVYQFISESKCEGHLHVKCTDCGKVFHLDSGISSHIKHDIKDSADFVIDNQSVLLGKCGKCR